MAPARSIPARGRVENALPTLLLTRPAAQSERFAKACRPAIGVGVKIVIAPVIRIEPLPAPDLRGFDGVILTSGNALAALDALQVQGLCAYCVDERTAAAARAMGMRAVSAQGNSDDLVAMLRDMAPGSRLIHPHGEVTTGDVAAKLRVAGVDVVSQVVYRQTPMPMSDAAHRALADDKCVVLPLFSPRSAALVSGQIGTATARLHLIALSQAVADAWSGPIPASIAIADRPDAAHMCDLVAACYGRARA